MMEKSLQTERTWSEDTDCKKSGQERQEEWTKKSAERSSQEAVQGETRHLP